MGKTLIPLLATAFVVLAMVYQAHTPETVLCEMPDVRLDEIEGFVSKPVPASEAERTILPPDTQIAKRVYEAGDGAWFQVSVVVGGRSKRSVHRPELCLPAQGYQMSNPRGMTAGDVSWRSVTLTRQNSSAMGFAYTFFNQEGFRTASHLSRIFRDVWDRSMRGRIDRWVMVTVYASSADDGRLRDFLVRLKEKGVVR